MPAYRLAAAQDTFAALARKAEDRGLPVPTIAEVSRETIGAGELAEVWVTSRILGAAPVLDGWRGGATLTAHKDGVLVCAADGEVVSDEGLSMRCDPATASSSATSPTCCAMPKVSRSSSAPRA